MNRRTTIIVVSGLIVLGLTMLHRPQRIEPVTPPEQTHPLPTKRGLKPRQPAPRMLIAAASAPEAGLAGNAFARMLKNEGAPPKLNRAQVEVYLAEQRRSAESLIAAFRVTDDRSLLQEAADKYPNDPRVQYAGWFAANHNSGSSPEERRQWLQAFAQSAPDNALAGYLSAQDYFKSGQHDRAVAELITAAGKARFQSYTADYNQNMEEAYLSAGYSVVEAKSAAWCSDLTLSAQPPVSELKHLAENLGELAKQCRQAGDEASAQAVLQMGVELGRRLEDTVGGGSLVVQNGTGAYIQRELFSMMDPNAPYDNTGQTVQNQLDALRQRGNSWSGLWKQAEPVLQTMSDQDLVSYYDRMKVFGEVAALHWVVNR